MHNFFLFLLSDADLEAALNVTHEEVEINGYQAFHEPTTNGIQKRNELVAHFR
jgi:hypothetical protein